MSNALLSIYTMQSPVVDRPAAVETVVTPGPRLARPGPGSPLATDGRNFGVGHKR